MGRGIIEAQTLRTEQFDFEARTSDPTNTQPGEYWIRTDQTSSNPDIIAELRRQDTSGVTTCPIFAASEESNLGSDVTRGPSVVLADGSVGFVAMTTGGGAVGSPRAVTAAGAEYVSHDGLLNPIPDSVIHRWPFDEGSGTTAADAIGGATASGIDSSMWQARSDAVGGYELDFNSSDNDSITSSASVADAGLTLFQTIDVGSISNSQHIQELNGGYNQGDCYLRIGQDGTNVLRWAVQNDGSNESRITHSISSGRHRIVVYLDPSVPELGIAVDGSVQKTTSPNANFTSSHDGQHAIGFGNVVSRNYFDGSVDNPAIQNQAASTSYIQEDYNNQPWS